MNRRRIIAPLWCGCIAALLVAASSAFGQGRWRTYENARLDESAYYDGDSFWIRAGRHRAIYRIYYVDAPEEDMSVPERVRDQARYWGISEEEVLRLGREATRFARDFMRGGVTVHTRRQDARGRSRAPRYFGFIEANGAFLCAALVRAGLGRVYGFATDLPDGTPEVRYWALLRRLEREAREEGVGAWAVRDADRNAQRRITTPPEVSGRMGVMRRTASVRQVDPPHAVMGLLRAGSRVEIVEAVTPTLVRIRFDAGDARAEGLCHLADIEIEP